MSGDGKLTREALDAAFEAIKKQGSGPRHDCRFDGHVIAFGANRCIYCGATPEETR